MIKSIMVARSDNHVIGKDNQLPWQMPADLRYFKQTTMGHYCIMGRKTFESVDNPLPGRTNVIITRQPEYHAEGCLVVHNLDEAFRKGEEQAQKEIFVLGGAEIYKQALAVVDRIYLTEIKTIVDGDTFFPPLDPNQWKETKREEHSADEKNLYDYAFVVLEKV